MGGLPLVLAQWGPRRTDGALPGRGRARLNRMF